MIRNKTIRTVILIVFVFASVIFISSCSDAFKASLSSFVSVSTTGISGEGTATLHIDWEGIKNQVLGPSPSEAEAAADYNTKATNLKNSVSIVLDKTSGLSNGDTVIIKIICTEAISKAYNIKMRENITVTLNDFVIQQGIDLFADLDVVFTGFSPNIKVHINNMSQNEFLKTVTFTANKTEGLMLGDNVLITATYSQEIADSLGYLPFETTKEYNVQDVAYYPYSFVQVPSDLVRSLMDLSLEQINERWEDYSAVILSVFGSSIDREPYLESSFKDVQIYDPVLMEVIFLSRNDISGAWFGSYNYLFFVYKTVVNDSVLNKNTEIYQCVVFSDIFVNEFGGFTYSQWITDKPQYEMVSVKSLFEILEEEYMKYDYEVVLK